MIDIGNNLFAAVIVVAASTFGSIHALVNRPRATQQPQTARRNLDNDKVLRDLADLNAELDVLRDQVAALNAARRTDQDPTVIIDTDEDWPEVRPICNIQGVA